MINDTGLAQLLAGYRFLTRIGAVFCNNSGNGVSGGVIRGRRGAGSDRGIQVSPSPAYIRTPKHKTTLPFKVVRSDPECHRYRYHEYFKDNDLDNRN